MHSNFGKHGSGLALAWVLSGILAATVATGQESTKAAGMTAAARTTTRQAAPAGPRPALPAAQVNGAGTGSNTVITAEVLEFDYKNLMAVFQGNVDVVDPEVRMKADELSVLFDKENSVKTVTASGHVTIWQADRTATCERAVYAAKEGEVVMTGTATLSRGRDTVRGDRITFWVNEERMRVEPGTLIVYPQAGKGSASLLPTPKLGPTNR